MQHSHLKYDNHTVLLKFITAEFYKLSGHNPLTTNYDPITIKKHVQWMWTELGQSSSKGYIVEKDLNLYNHPIYGIVLRLFPSMDNIFTTTTIEEKGEKGENIQHFNNSKENTITPTLQLKNAQRWVISHKMAVTENALFHREHLTNLILLILINDIALMKQKTTSFSPEIGKEITKDAREGKHHEKHSKEAIECFYDTLFLRDTLTRAISGNIRKAVGMNRIRYQERVYSGFDTEYVQLDNPDFRNELLCSTTALFSRSFLRIQKLKSENVNFSLSMGKDSRKLSTDLAKLIFTQLLYLRFLDDRNDHEIEKLIKFLKSDVKDLFCYEENDSYLFTFQKVFSKDKFITCFNDHRGDPSGYSLKFLIEQIKQVTKTQRDAYLKEWVDLLKAYGYTDLKERQRSIYFPLFNISVLRRLEVCLIGHYTAADVSSWSDYPIYKENLSILQKGFVTLGKGFRLLNKTTAGVKNVKTPSYLFGQTSTVHTPSSLTKDIKDINSPVHRLDISKTGESHARFPNTTTTVDTHTLNATSVTMVGEDGDDKGIDHGHSIPLTVDRDKEEEEGETGIVKMKEDLNETCVIYLRDTNLLSPSPSSSLAALASLYTEQGIKKIILPKGQIKRMNELFVNDPDLFKEYALSDSVVALFHALTVEDSYYKFLQKLSIPVTISSLAQGFYSKYLPDVTPPSPNKLFGLKDIASIYTPKGVNLSGDLSDYIHHFMGSYHGGRNESFVYGYAAGLWKDYDLPGAYATACSLLDVPDYKGLRLFSTMTSSDLLKELNENDLLNAYSSFKVSFKFPPSVRFPNIPVRLDTSSIVFPLEGSTTITSLELVMALKLGCSIDIISGVFIPFKTLSQKKAKEALALKKKQQKADAKRLKETRYRKATAGDGSGDDDDDDGDDLSNSVFEFEDRFNLKRDRNSYEKLNLNSDEFNLILNRDFCIFLELYEELLNESRPSENNTQKTEEEEEVQQPTDKSFKGLMKFLTEMRKKTPKGSFENLLYKLIANAGIGQMARGLDRKSKLDAKTGVLKTIPGTDMTNPLLAGWVTSFIRCVISELLNYLDSKGYIVISVTTDGFITNHPSLETIPSQDEGTFVKMYLDARKNIDVRNIEDQKRNILEVKFSEEVGIISWTTRGQIGMSTYLKAMTGYQPKYFTMDELRSLAKEKLRDSGSKSIFYNASRLRGATDIYKYGGDVTMVYTERRFSFSFDNRRQLISKGDNTDFSVDYVYSKPFGTTEECSTYRSVNKLLNDKYLENSPLPSLNKDKTLAGRVARMFVRGFYQQKNYLNLENLEFNRMELALFVKKLTGVSLSLNNISLQKNRPFSPVTIVSYDKLSMTIGLIKEAAPDFSTERFFNVE